MELEEIRLLAMAKLNLTLDIRGRRADGYHEIETVMQSVTLADTVRLHRTGSGRLELRCSDSALPAGPENLAWRAAEAFFRAAGRSNSGIAMEIRKEIPAGAGLAGGSADAAAVLAGLDCLLDTHCGRERLCAVGASLGADIPFCLTGGTCLARGKGERLEPVPALPACEIVVAKPAESVSTAAAYRAFDRIADPVHPRLPAVTAALAAGDLAGVARNLGNVFEQAGAPAAVAAIRAAMREEGALGSAMTGSGSAVFGLFDCPERAKSCAARLGERMAAFLCRPAARGWEMQA